MNIDYWALIIDHLIIEFSRNRLDNYTQKNLNLEKIPKARIISSWFLVKPKPDKTKTSQYRTATTSYPCCIPALGD